MPSAGELSVTIHRQTCSVNCVLDYRVGDLVGEQAEGAQGVIIAGITESTSSDRTGVHDRDHRNPAALPAL
jgi:hypothetical protein